MFALFGYPSDADNSVCEILAEPREQKRIHTESPDVGAHAPGDRSLKREPETLNELPRVGKSKEADAKPAVVIGTPCTAGVRGTPAQVNPSLPMQGVVSLCKQVPDPGAVSPRQVVRTLNTQRGGRASPSSKADQNMGSPLKICKLSQWGW